MKKLYFLLTLFLLGFQIPQNVIAQITCSDEISVFNNYDVYAALPNIFTPNNDGINDLLVIYNSFAQQRLIQITDTTANNTLLFSSEATDETAFWDGLDDNGMEAPEAAYNLKVDYFFGNGTVTLTCRTIYLIRENCIDLNDVTLNFPTDFDDLALVFKDTETTLPDCTPVGINELYNVEADVQPTVARNKIMVNSIEPVSNFKIYNLQGKTMITNKISNVVNFEVKVEELKTGVYFLALNHNGKFSIHQFFKG